MDLDEIKKTWSGLDSGVIRKEKITTILENVKHGTFEKLIKFEKWGVLLFLVLLPFNYFLLEKNLFTGLFFLVGILFALLSQIYKYRFLKNTNLTSMNLLEVSIRISKYRIYLYREFSIAIVWCIVFVSCFSYFIIHQDPSYKLDVNENLETTTIILLSVWSLIVVPLVAWILLKCLFLKNIKKVEQSLDEASEYMKDNDSIQ